MNGLPEKWAFPALSEVCTLLNGRAYKQHELLTTGKYPVLRVGNLFTTKHWYYSDIELDDDKYIDSGDLIYAWSASFGPHIWRGAKVIFHYHIWKCAIDSEIILRDYLYYILLWDTGQIKSDFGTGSTMIHVTKGDMDRRKIPLAPVFEQCRIVASLNNLFARTKAARNELSRIPRLIDHYKRAILEKAFTGELTKEWRDFSIGNSPVLQDELDSQRGHLAHELGCRSQSWRLPLDTGLFELPTSWVWNVVGNLAVHRSGLAFKSSDFGSKGTQVVRLGNLYQGDLDLGRSPVRIDLSGKDYDAFFTRDGDLLVSQTGTKYKKDYGYFVRLPRNSEKLLVNQRVLCISPIDNVYGDYIFHFTRSAFFRDYFFSHETGGVNQGNVGIDGVMTAPIPLPPYEELKQIVRRLESAMSWLNVVAAESAKAEHPLDHLNQAILEKAFLGKLVPQDPNDEPAEKLLARIRAARDEQPKPRRSHKTKAAAA